jgi:hypothetical protein
MVKKNKPTPSKTLKKQNPEWTTPPNEKGGEGEKWGGEKKGGFIQQMGRWCVVKKITRWKM